MDKVYLLLRNNQQTGPYTLEQLTHAGLLPTDLVWEEGLSTCWFDPFKQGLIEKQAVKNDAIEAETKNSQATQMHLAFKQMPAEATAPVNLATRPSKTIYVSLPNKAEAIPQQAINSQQPAPIDHLGEKADQLRKRALASTPADSRIQPPIEVKLKPNTASTPVQESPFARKDHFNSKLSKVLSSVLPGAFIFSVLFFMVSFLLATYIYPEKKIERDRGVRQLPGRQVSSPVTPPGRIQSDFAAEIPNTSVPDTLTAVPPGKSAVASSKRKNTVRMKKQPVKKFKIPEVNVQEEQAGSKVPPVADNQRVIAALKEEGDVIIPPPAKSKTLGQRLKTFFGKSRRKTPQTPDSPH